MFVIQRTNNVIVVTAPRVWDGCLARRLGSCEVAVKRLQLYDSKEECGIHRLEKCFHFSVSYQ